MHRILIVEDETVIRTALRRLLERNNYQVIESGSVQEAITANELEDFDLIISDLRLPGAPGTDLISKAGEVPVLIMTSYASLRSAVDSMRMGAVDYIAKPFDHSDMIAAVQRIIADHPRRGRRRNRNASGRGPTMTASAGYWATARPCRPCLNIFARWPPPIPRCWCWVKPGPARKSSPAACIATASVRTRR